jgi:filamentous hemagglutinin
MQLSEQGRSDAALAACNQGDAASCSTYKSLQATSQQRDADLANACGGGFSSQGCRAQVAAALAGGNDVQPVNGTMYAFDPNGPAIKSIPDSYSTAYSGSFDGTAAQSLADALPLTPIGIGDIAAGFQALKGFGSTLFGTSALDAGIQWGRGIMGQGMPWEDFLATQMPAGSRLPPNFKTFDFYDPVSGVATSAKTLDTTTAAKLADPSQVYSSLKGNIDAAADFSSYRLGATRLTSDMITSRDLQVAIPANTTAAQWQQINNAVQYGASKGVKVTITVTK